MEPEIKIYDAPVPQRINIISPALILGSDFVSILQAYYRQGNIEQMIALTSKATLEKFRVERVRRYYGDIQFGYYLRLTSVSLSNNIYHMNYEATIDATRVIVRFQVEREGDQFKLQLPNITNEFLGTVTAVN